MTRRTHDVRNPRSRFHCRSRGVAAAVSASLEAAQGSEADAPAGTVAYVATSVGQHSTELVLAVDAEVQRALAALDDLTAEEALRPVLEEPPSASDRVSSARSTAARRNGV